MAPESYDCFLSYRRARRVHQSPRPGSPRHSHRRRKLPDPPHPPQKIAPPKPVHINFKKSTHPFQQLTALPRHNPQTPLYCLLAGGLPPTQRAGSPWWANRRRNGLGNRSAALSDSLRTRQPRRSSGFSSSPQKCLPNSIPHPSPSPHPRLWASNCLSAFITVHLCPNGVRIVTPAISSPVIGFVLKNPNWLRIAYPCESTSIPVRDGPAAHEQP